MKDQTRATQGRTYVRPALKKQRRLSKVLRGSFVVVTDGRPTD